MRKTPFLAGFLGILCVATVAQGAMGAKSIERAEVAVEALPPIARVRVIDQGVTEIVRIASNTPAELLPLVRHAELRASHVMLSEATLSSVEAERSRSTKHAPVSPLLSIVDQ